jgi:uncharacterized membrane protein
MPIAGILAVAILVVPTPFPRVAYAAGDADSPTRVRVTDITNDGLVVGSGIWGSSPFRRAITWQDGEFTDLDPGVVWYESKALAANSRGQVVGFGVAYYPRPRPLLWDQGEIIDLVGSLVGSQEYPLGKAVGINNRGQVVLSYFDETMEDSDGCICTHAYIWDRGELTDLGPTTASPYLESDRVGLKINGRGDVIGDHDQGSFFWRNGVRTELPFLAEDLNDRGQVVGGSFLWEDGVLTTIESIDGESVKALAINNRGEVAGLSWDLRPFRWARGQMELLEPVGYWVVQHVDVNDRGQIVGIQGCNPFGAGDAGGRYILWDTNQVVGLDLTASVGSHHRCWYTAISINAAGRIVFILGGPEDEQSYLWDHGDVTPLVPPAGPNPLGFKTSAPVAVASPGFDSSMPPAGDGWFGSSGVERNPSFGPVTLRFTLPARSTVDAAVFDVQGRRVRSLVGVEREAGAQQLFWDGRDDAGQTAPAGIYFLRLEAGPHRLVERVTRLR